MSIFTFIGDWNNFIFPLVLTTSDSNRTLPLAVTNYQGEYSSNIPVILTVVVLSALPLVIFYLLQRRGLFARLARLTARLAARRDWSKLVGRAETIDQAIEHTHGRGNRIAASFALSLVGWLVGTGEVYWMLGLLAHPVSWSDALLVESLGQAIRGAGFAIPGSLGVQEGGYLLIAPLAGLPSDVG